MDMPVTYGDIVRADLMAIDKTERSDCCGYPLFEKRNGDKFCSQCLKEPPTPKNQKE